MADRDDVSAGQGERGPLVLDSYGRLSRVPETGELEKIETQWADNRRVIDRIGAQLGAELSDGLSAWKRGVRRKGWEMLLARVQSGVSDGIVVWHVDRLFRQPRDLEKLIDLADKGFRIVSAHGTRDLSDPDDRFILRIEVAHAARSSDDTSRRTKRRIAAKREAGTVYVGGPRRFGWPGGDLTWKPTDGQTDADRPQVPAELVAREKAALRQAAEDMLTGVSQGEVVRAWNKAGLLTVNGLIWTARSLRSVMLRASNALLIEHEGKLLGRAPGEPILAPEVFERIRALYAGRRRGRIVGERYIATGILRCARCGLTLSAKKVSSTKSGFYPGTTQRKAVYFCHPDRRGCGKVSIDVRATDKRLRALTASRLSDPRHAAAVSAARARVAEELTRVRKELAECLRIQEALTERAARREIALDAFDRANGPLQADIARLKARDTELSGGNLDGPLQPQSMEEILRQWDEGEISDKRTLLRSALGATTIYVDPYKHTAPRKRVFDPTRIRLVGPDDDSQPLASE